MTLNMLVERAECLGGNMAHEHLTDDIGCNPRANGPPTPGEVVLNAHMDERTVRVQKPGDVHPATDPADMRKVDAMLVRFQALPGRPAHGKAVTMRRHLHQSFCRLPGEHFDPTIMR